MSFLSSLSLFEVIKQKSEEKGRPLKIICDWDEVVFPHKSLCYWKFYLHNTKSANIPRKYDFSSFFVKFWENVKEWPSIRKWDKINTNFEEIENYPKDRKIFREIRKDPFFYEVAFLSIGEEIIKAQKEGIISELVFINAFRKKGAEMEGLEGKYDEGDPRKRKKFLKTFGKFPNSKLNLVEIKSSSQLIDTEADQRAIFSQDKPKRWEWIKENHPDFDIFIDDSAFILENSLRELDKSKIIVATDYECNRYLRGSNLVFVKNTVSDITDQDFAIAALEYRTKKLEQGISELKTIKKVNPTPGWLIVFSIISGFLGILLLVITWKRKPKS